MLTSEQLEIRKRGVTGSEIAAVAGLSPWASAQDVWARKFGLDPGPEKTAAMERGNFLEPALVAWVADRAGVRIDSEQRTLVCPDHDLVIATPDGIAYWPDDPAPIAVVEVKAPGWRTAKDWIDPGEVPDGIPIYYLPQVTWEMAAAQLDQAIVGALVDGDLLTYQIRFNEDLFHALLAKAEAFWNFVRTRRPPPVDPASADPGRWLRAYYAEQADEDWVEPVGDVLADMEAAVRAYIEARDTAAAAEKAKKAAAAVLQSTIGGHAGARGDGWKATWKQTKGSDVTDYAEIVRALNVPEEMIAQYTRHKPGYRALRVSLKESNNE